MEVLTRTELQIRIKEILERIAYGEIFIYPTDTIYGLGCNALNQKAVQKIRQLKAGRPTAPFSILVPTLEWVKKNGIINKKTEKWLSQLPGPLTIIINLKNKKAIAKNVAPGMDTVGIRYPDHWFSRVVELLGVPIVTTSANKSREQFMTSIENIDPDLQKAVSFVIYEGPKAGRPSKIVHVEKEEVKER